MPRSRKFIISASAKTKIAYQARDGLGHGSAPAGMGALPSICTVIGFPRAMFAGRHW